MASQLLLVELQLLLKSRELVNHLLLGVLKLLDHARALLLLLLKVELEVLPLGLHNLSQLCFLIPKLVSILLELLDFLNILRLNLRQFSQNGVVELLVPSKMLIPTIHVIVTINLAVSSNLWRIHC